VRLQSIHLQWFRGAASQATLNLFGKSSVIYGTNGAGKSSFVDGIESILGAGKVGHLGHEYSGRNQEKGLINVARPSGQHSKVEITLVDGSSETLTWQSTAPARTQQGATAMGNWDYRRTALRQEELSEFIRDTKRDKYSAVLPLLGLSRLEAVAENLRKLCKAIERQGDLPTFRAKLEIAADRRKEVFGDQTNEQLIARLEVLRLTYAPAATVESRARTVADVQTAIDAQIASLDADQRRSAVIGEVGASDLQGRLSKVIEAATKISEVAEPLIKERLDVLSAADGFVTAGSLLQGPMPCPACGRKIEADDFREHVANERDRLSAAQKLYDEHRAAIGELVDEVGRLRNVFAKKDLAGWLEALSPADKLAVKYFDELSLVDLRTTCGPENIRGLQTNLLPLVVRAADDAKAFQPTVQSLVEHQNEARALSGSIKASAIRAGLNRADALINLVKSLEAGVLQEIAERARQTFEAISHDIQRYWKVLQPNDVITDVRLVVPEDNDKAVEVALRFHGKVQDSPRLTLSEGQRNALGLCIFLAMANKAGSDDRPVVLDDVVISFDREHRSRVGMLLRQEFSTRQIVLLTHDREWFFELQRTLPVSQWSFRRLRPFLGPREGIMFADHGVDIAAAKARAKTDPEEALGNVRRLMDVALSEIAERIGLAVPHLRGDDNDHRTAGQFLVALERAATKSFRKKGVDTYEPHAFALAAIKKAKPELAIWGNRGTHSFSGSLTEAEDLISGCEAVLSSFMCDSCGTPVGAFDSTGGKVECRCGSLQWRPE
jgi:hypothetical protein